MTTISESDYFKMLGLCALAKEHVKILNYIEAALGEMFPDHDQGNGYYGHISDAIFEDDPANHIIDRLKLEYKAKAEVK